MTAPQNQSASISGSALASTASKSRKTNELGELLIGVDSGHFDGNLIAVPFLFGILIPLFVAAAIPSLLGIGVAVTMGLSYIAGSAAIYKHGRRTKTKNLEYRDR
jgi:hypothetical protein